MLGTFEPRKGHAFVLKAFKVVLKKFPKVHLVIAGYGSSKEVTNVSELISTLNIKDNVHLLGFRDDKENLLINSDLLLIGSQSFESFGYTAIEAMANKTPVISTNVGGLSEVIRNGEGGYCFHPDDVRNYSKKSLNFLKTKILEILKD